MNEAEVVERMALIADDQPPEVAQPGEEALHLPPPLVAPQGTAVLGLRLLPIASMRCNHLDA